MRTRAAVIYEMEKSEPYAQTLPLIVEEVELDAPGPGEVLVELVGAGLCHSDLSTINGTIPRLMPMILGHEASGIVREVGPGVSEVKPDDHVVFSFVPTCGHCLYCAIGRPALCINGTKANNAGTLLDGCVRFHQPNGQPILHYLGVSAFSQYTVAAQESLIKIDQAIPLDKAALFGCALLTGIGAVINTAQPLRRASRIKHGGNQRGLSFVPVPNHRNISYVCTFVDFHREAPCSPTAT